MTKNSRRLLVGLLLASGSFSALRAEDGAGPWSGVFRDAGADAAALSDPEAGGHVKRSRLLALDAGALFSAEARAAAGEAVTLNLFADRRLEAVRREVDLGIGDAPLWYGELVNDPEGYAIFVMNQDAVMGKVHSPLHGVYEVHYAGPGLSWVREIDLSVLPGCGNAPERADLLVPGADPAAPVAGPEEAPGGRRGVSTRPPVDIRGVASGQFIFADVLMVYTPAARAAVGGTAAMEALIDSAIAETNLAYERSQVSLRVRAAHKHETPYTQHPSDMGTDLSLLRGISDGSMDEVHALRNDHGADLVALLVNTATNACGIAYLMTSVGPSFQSSAFSVTARTCLSGFTLPHELGHNMGLAHDRDNAGSASHVFAYGYRAPGAAFRTIMAYAPGTRILNFSNPDVLFNGQPTGNPLNHPTNPTHNALALNLNADTIAAWRILFTQPPGAFALLSPANGGTSANRSPVLSWEAADQTDYYRVELSNDPSFTTTIINAAPVSTNSYALPTAPPLALMSGAEYHWRVTAYNPLGQQSSSPAATNFFTPSNMPGPFTLTSPADGASNISRNPTLVWTGSVDADTFRVVVDDDPDFSSPVIDIAGLTSFSYTYLGTPLSPLTTYYWKVEATNVTGTTLSTPSSRSFQTIGTQPGPFSLTGPADGAFLTIYTPTLTWTESLQADSYTIIVDDELSLMNPEVLVTGHTGTSYHIPAGTLQNNTRYYWQVRAVNPTGTTTATPTVATFAITVPFCLGDANADGFVNFGDISSVLANWGGGGPLGDANNDGQVNFVDISTVLGVWGFVCP